MIKIKSLKKSFGKVLVLKGLDMEVAHGEQVVIRGGSGSGKSTLLYLLGGLDRPDSGEIFVSNRKLADLNDADLALYRNQHVGFVFQFHYLLPTLTSLQNIYLPSRIGGKVDQALERRVQALAHELGVVACLNKYPYELSGGEQQRINIIRALSRSPKLLLCDEPTGNLDSKNSERVIILLSELALEFKSTLLIVTHDDKVAAHVKRHIHILDGQILQ